MRPRLALLILAAALAAPGSAAAASPRVVGGSVIAASQAPYAVFVSSAHITCTGVVINARTIWTAAHCVIDEEAPHTVRPASDYTVQAGLNRDGTDDGHTQKVGVSAIRAHPGWPADLGDDVAVLTLATPLDLTGAYVKPITVASSQPPAGTVIRAIGYGISASGDAPPAPDGRLRAIDETLGAPFDCTQENALQLCSSTPSGATCNGDSGGPVVLPGATPVLVGLNARGPDGCPAGATDVTANITAPELRQFLAGSATPPHAPRLGTPTPSYQVVEVVGQTMTCAPGAFSDAPAYSGIFRDADSGAVLQTGGLSYTFAPSDAGHRIQCVVVASNAGGTTQIALTPTDPITALRDPGLTLARFSRTAYAISSLGDATTATLVTTDAGGRVVRSITLTPGQVASRIPLPEGTYQTCLSTPQTTYDAAGRVCLTDVFTDNRGVTRASALVRRHFRHCHGSRCTVTLTVAADAVSQRVHLQWVFSHRGTRTRTVTRVARLQAHTVARSPSVPRHRSVRLRVLLPTFGR